MKNILLLLLVVGSGCLYAQVATTPAPVPENKNMSLDERFQNMKSKSESYQDYKVIKSTTLDAEWKIIMDSIRANKAIWQEVKRSIAAQKLELTNSQKALQDKETSMTDIIYSSDHISFAG